MKITPFVQIAIFVAFALTGCTVSEEPPPALSIEYGTYSCNGSEQFVAEFQESGNKVALMYGDRTHILVRDATGTYTDGTLSLTGSETAPITVFESGVPIFENCVPLTTQKQYYRKDKKFSIFNPSRSLPIPTY